jgi:hypothetical protein
VKVDPALPVYESLEAYLKQIRILTGIRTAALPSPALLPESEVWRVCMADSSVRSRDSKKIIRKKRGQFEELVRILELPAFHSLRLHGWLIYLPGKEPAIVKHFHADYLAQLKKGIHQVFQHQHLLRTQAVIEFYFKLYALE